MNLHTDACYEIARSLFLEHLDVRVDVAKHQLRFFQYKNRIRLCIIFEGNMTFIDQPDFPTAWGTIKAIVPDNEATCY